MKTVCMVIPIYREIPQEDEILSIEQSIQRLSNVDTFFIAPETLNTEYYEKKYNKVKINKYSVWRNTIASYSKLLLSEKFYRDYLSYEYMLICQTDALILGTEQDLMHFCEMGYDYYGAPWESYQEVEGREIPKFVIKKWQKVELIHKLCFVRRCQVGNGGFSLRKINACLKLLEGHKWALKLWRDNEDLFFAYYDEKNKKYPLSRNEKISLDIVPYDVALTFAREENLIELLNKEKMPFGVHAWKKDCPNFMEKYRGNYVN